jgi:hypothetical protein
VCFFGAECSCTIAFEICFILAKYMSFDWVAAKVYDVQKADSGCDGKLVGRTPPYLIRHTAVSSWHRYGDGVTVNRNRKASSLSLDGTVRGSVRPSTVLYGVWK